METQPRERIDEQHSGETPEDVAILYSWANLQGAKYRDFSANRREYRAQMRHRAAEQLRLMELKAQAAAEAAAAQAEAGAAAAHAEADAAAVKLAESRSSPSITPGETLREKAVEEARSASLREAAQQARRAATERLEAARRAEAAALADSLARHEECEIMDAQASALRQEAQYHHADVRAKQLIAQHPVNEDQVPGRISDPYSLQILAEGEYYDGPGSPPSELVASRFRSQREYIERSTGTELPPFKMPPSFDEDLPRQQTRLAPGEARRPELPSQAAARQTFEVNKESRSLAAERHLHQEGNTFIPPAEWPRRNDDLSELKAERDDKRKSRNGEPPVAIREAHQAAERREEQRRTENYRAQLYSATPRQSGMWLRQISGHGPEAASSREPIDSSVPVTKSDKELEPEPPRSSVEATYGDYHRNNRPESDEHPSGFRPPWLMQAQAPRRSGPRFAEEELEPEKPIPRWFLPGQPKNSAYDAEDREPVQALAPDPHLEITPGQGVGSADGSGAETEEGVQTAQERVRSRWFALNSIYGRLDTPGSPERPAPSHESLAPILVVYSLAGGVGKTSLVAALGRTLSSIGEKVLLAETTSYGLLPFYFGADQLISGAVRTFLPPHGSSDAPIHMVNYGLDQGTLDPQAQHRVVDDLLASGQRANRILIDLNAGCEWVINRIARPHPTVLVPLAPDINSVASIQTLEKKLTAMQSAEGERVLPVYLINQFDASLPLHLDLREVLRQRLGDRLLPFAIRRAQGISEALAESMTILDYDPGSPATEDFSELANWVRAACAAAPAGLRAMRWCER